MSESLAPILHRRATETPNAPMIAFSDRSLTYGTALQTALRWAAAFRAHGGGPGGIVLIAMPNQADFAAAFFGAHFAGMAAAPLPPRRGETAAEFAGRIEARAHTVGARLLALGEPPESPRPKRIAILWPDLLPAVPADVGEMPPIEDNGLIQFTSGTSGMAKAVLLTQGGLSYPAARLNEGLSVDRAKDHALSWLPLYHDMGLFGFLLAPLYSGTQSTIMKTETFVRHPNQWFEAIARTGATITAAPPSAFAVAARFARRRSGERVDLSSLRVALIGAELIEPAVLGEIEESLATFGVAPEAVMPAYGLAEIGVAATLTPVRRGARRSGYRENCGMERHAVSCGRPVAGTNILILNGAEVLSDSEVGSIALKSPSRMLHYLTGSGPQLPNEVNGWMLTGDRGFIRDGELHVLGREDDLIIVGGIKFMPEEIEDVAYACGGPEVQSAVVVGYRPEGATTQKVALMLHATRIDQASQDRLVIKIRHNLVRLGLPIDRIDFITSAKSLRTANGKRSRASYRTLLSSGSV